jgi:phage-related protein
MKPLHWVGSTLDDVKEFPEEVRSEVGFSLYLAQLGEKALNAVPMVGFGSSKVLEVVIDDSGNTYRSIYTVKFPKAVYAIHAFQKKSTRGTATPQPDLRLIRKRLRAAEQHYRDAYEKITRKERGRERGT